MIPIVWKIPVLAAGCLLLGIADSRAEILTFDELELNYGNLFPGLYGFDFENIGYVSPVEYTPEGYTHGHWNVIYNGFGLPAHITRSQHPFTITRLLLGSAFRENLHVVFTGTRANGEEVTKAFDVENTGGKRVQLDFTDIIALRISSTDGVGPHPEEGLYQCWMDEIEYTASDRLAVRTAQWSPDLGGAIATITTGNSPLPADKTLQACWAGDEGLIPSPVIAQWSLTAGLTGEHTVHLPGPAIGPPPAGANRICFRITEAENPYFLHDPVLTIPPEKAASVSAYSRAIIIAALRRAGEDTAEITATSRTPHQQAQAIFDLITGPFDPITMAKAGATTIIDYARHLYDANGDQLIDVYLAGIEAGKSATTIIADIEARITTLKVADPTAFRHTSDPTQLQLIDIAYTGIANPLRLHAATSTLADPRITHRLDRSTQPIERTFHLEIPQPGSTPPPSIIAPSASAPPTAVPSNSTPPALTPATLLIPGNGIDFALATGTVSTGHIIHAIDLLRPGVLSAGLTATSVHTGTGDTVLHLFDSAGTLLETNDDTDPFSSTFHSELTAIPLSHPGRYYLAVTTFGNQPLLNAQNQITTWQDDGTSDIDFELIAKLTPIDPAITSTNGQAIIEWHHPGEFQESTDLQNWTPIPAARSPFIIDPQGQHFYRLSD
ncbi:DVUA0089 family protein [Luteolibacter soli]|uniref:DVUA0089 family protein n=1 Tax=Luteolibacter soli TaxID=3135280 RepID=A0ABU9AV00_9BACT